MATPMTSPHFDLNNMLSLQQKYALDLSEIPIDSSTNTSSNNAISNLNQQLSGLYNNVSNSQAGSQAVIFKQKIVNDILETENSRLKAKKNNIDTAISGQKRMIELNNNYQKRYAAYTKMIIAIVIGIILYIFMDRLKILLPFIPSFIFYFLVIVILGMIGLYVILMYLDILNRDNMNFDEYMLPPPDLSGTPSATSSGSGSGTDTGTPSAANAGALSLLDYSNCTAQSCCGLAADGKTQLSFSPTKGCYLAS